MKTAMQELIEDLKRLSPESSQMDNDVSKTYHEGLQWAILKATQRIPDERQQIVDTWNNAYAVGCSVGSNDYTTETEQDTGDQYYNQTFKN